MNTNVLAGRRPGRPRLLSEDEIVDAALRVVAQVGASRLSMRSVARELGVPPMTIYGYVPNKDALNSLVADRLLSKVRAPAPDDGPWDQRLCRLLCDARRMLVERPELSDGNADPGPGALQLLRRGAYGGEASRLAGAVMDLLRQGGFHADDVHACFVTLFTYVTGHIDATSADDTNASEDEPSGSRSSTAIFELGTRALIEGLRATLGAIESPSDAPDAGEAIPPKVAPTQR
jgi:AcrR family transcriptional regulator